MMADLNVDEDNINTEIVSFLVEEILKKAEFFDLYKENVRGTNDLIISDQLTRLKAKEALIPTNELVKNNQKMALFRRVEDLRSPAIVRGAESRKLDSVMLDQLIQKDRNSKAVFSGLHADTDMKSLEEVHKERAKASFIAECERNLVVALPLLLRIKDKQIVLQRYHLNHGLCQALSLALSQFPDIATDFFFEANNLSDDDFAVLLDGMSRLTFVNSLSYKYNGFGAKSLEALLPIISQKQ